MKARSSKNDDTVGLLLAGGYGTRLGLGPKAFLKVEGKTILAMAAERLRKCVNRIIVGVPEEYMALARTVLEEGAEVYSGGRSRQETISILLNRCAMPIVLIMDVARPFASAELINRVIQACRDHGASTATFPLNIPVIRHTRGIVDEVIASRSVFTPQSPQAFKHALLVRAYREVEKEAEVFQTTLEIVHRAGITFRLVPGEAENIKITDPLDWQIAKNVICPLLGGEEN